MGVTPFTLVTNLILFAPVNAATLAPEAVTTLPVTADQPMPTAAERPQVAAEPRPWGGPTSQLLWFDGKAGVESVEMRTFFADFNTVSAGFLPTSGVGPTASLGGGLRLVFLTLGARGMVASFEDSATVGSWQIWTLDLEVGLRIPLHRFEPHLTLAGGYCSFGGFGAAVRGVQAGVDVHGLDARFGGGLDYWVADNVSLGADVTGGLLAIARPGVALRDLASARQLGTLNDAKARILEANGSSVGTTLAMTVSLGVHF